MVFHRAKLVPFRLSSFYVAYFGTAGVILPFFPVWLISRGLTPENIGIIIGSATFVKFIANPVFAHLADRRGCHKFLIVALAASSFVFFAFYFVSYSFWPIFFVTVLFSSCWGSTQPLAESLTMLSSKNVNFEYGRVRLWGSIAFISIAFISGKILAGNSPNIILLLVYCTVGFMVVAAIFLPTLPSPVPPRVRFPILPLIRNIRFMIILLGAALIQSSHAVYYGFGTVHWQQSGISETVIGFLWGEGVIAEIVVFSFGASLLKYLMPMHLVTLGGIAGVLRWFGTGLDDSLPTLLFLQVLHGFTFGATHLGVIHFISEEIPEDFSATAMSLYAAVAMGLVMGLMVIASGYLYSAFEGKAYFIVAIISAFGSCLAYVAHKLKNATS